MQSERLEVSGNFNSNFFSSNPVSPQNQSFDFKHIKNSFSIVAEQPIALEPEESKQEKKRRTFSIKANSIFSRPASTPKNNLNASFTPSSNASFMQQDASMVEQPSRALYQSVIIDQPKP